MTKDTHTEQLRDTEELDNLIESLENDLEWMREQGNPHNATAHMNARMFLTLAVEIKALKAQLSDSNRRAA